MSSCQNPWNEYKQWLCNRKTHVPSSMGLFYYEKKNQVLYIFIINFLLKKKKSICLSDCEKGEDGFYFCVIFVSVFVTFVPVFCVCFHTVEILGYRGLMLAITNVHSAELGIGSMDSKAQMPGFK